MEGSRPANYLESLSPELLTYIIEDDCLSTEDVTALRLTCSIFYGSATAFLFRRISISALWRDRESFVNICHTPYLAQHVIQVEWQELAWFPGYFGSSVPSIPQDDESTDTVLAALDGLARDLFWLPVVPHESLNQISEPTAAWRTDAIRGFFETFCSCLQLLPKLHTVVSRMMTPDRVFHWCEYPIEAQQFQVHHYDGDQTHWDWCSDGLFHFIFSALDACELPVKRLAWQDVVRGCSAFGAPPPGVFRKLDTLSIILAPVPDPTPEVYNGLKSSLGEANNVRHLSLGAEISASGRARSHLNLGRVLLRAEEMNQGAGWTRLHSLSLTSLDFIHNLLVKLVEVNAETLRHLYLEGCDISFLTVQRMSQIQNLNLESIRIISEYVIGQCHRVPEHKLVQYINNQIIPEGDDVTPSEEKDLVFDRSGSEIADGSCDFFEEILNPFVQGASQYALNALVVTTPVFQLGGSSIDDFLFQPPRKYDIGYAESEGSDDYTQRIAAPNWIWGRYFNENKTTGVVYCTQVSDSHPHGSPTKLWKFTSREGDVHFGSEPLAAFEVWDPEAGDMEEPTPYCQELKAFVMQMGRQNRLYSLQDYVGTVHPITDILTKIEPPEGSWKYDATEALVAFRRMSDNYHDIWDGYNAAA